MRSTFNILFYVNKSKGKNGVVPVMGRVTINCTQSHFFDKRSGRAERSCKKSIPLALWDAKGRSNLFRFAPAKNCAKGRSPSRFSHFSVANLVKNLRFHSSMNNFLLKSHKI